MAAREVAQTLRAETLNCYTITTSCLNTYEKEIVNSCSWTIYIGLLYIFFWGKAVKIIA
jgi:hypothetical protein